MGRSDDDVNSGMEHSHGEEDCDDILSEHSLSMRKAARYCLSVLSKSKYVVKLTRIRLHPTKTGFLKSQRDRRIQAYNEFWARESQSDFPSWNSSDLSRQAFSKEFEGSNIPCLINFENDKIGCFEFLNQNWRQDLKKGNGISSNDTIGVNREWFLDTMGPDRPVPIRIQPSNQDTSIILDEDGRAMECRTQNLALQEWVDLLDRADDKQLLLSNQYLKDWHLQLWLQSEGHPPVYDFPSFFGHDLLNDFQTRFYPNGDYRFCYWGPKGSCTSRHSDVLHSFSWSYNVVGTKEWTFYPREHKNEDDNDESSQPPIVVRQRSGQVMFVPSQWQHQVVNLEETLSINHNWITVANMDLCWECLESEMTLIEQELQKWDDHDTQGSNHILSHLDSEVLESMLRGCVGLDVTAFILMILVRICDLIVVEMSKNKHDDFKEENDTITEMKELLDMLGVVTGDFDMGDNPSKGINVRGRLSAVLQSERLVVELLDRIGNILK